MESSARGPNTGTGPDTGHRQWGHVANMEQSIGSFLRLGIKILDLVSRHNSIHILVLLSSNVQSSLLSRRERERAQFGCYYVSAYWLLVASEWGGSG